MSDAVREFCDVSQNLPSLKKRRLEDCRAAKETRRAAEQVLLDSLDVGGAALTSIGDATYVVRSKVKLSHPPCTSAVVEKVQALWADPVALKAGLLSSEGGDVAECLSAYVARAVMEEPRETRVLQILPMKRVAEELPEAAPCIQDLVRSYVVSREEMTKGKEEFLEEQKQLSERRGDAEAVLMEELREAPAKIRTVSLVDADSGQEASFYLRVKPPKTPIKKKITHKVLSKCLHELVDEALGGAGPEVACSRLFGERLCVSLAAALREHEISAPVGPPRVALDRIRTSGA